MQNHEYHSIEERIISRMEKGMLDFISFGPEDGINHFIIQGPKQIPKSDKGTPLAIYGYFPKTFGPSGTAIVRFKQGIDEEEYRDKILRLQVPQEMQYLVQDNEDARHRFEEIVRSDLYPSFALIFIQRSQSSEDVVILYSIFGVSAKTALTEIQNGLRNGSQN